MSKVYELDLANYKRKKHSAPNLASNKDINDEVKKLIISRWSQINSRGDIETIWNDTDKLFRNVPLETNFESRAETSTNSYCVAVRQLKAFTMKLFYDHLQDYRFVPSGVDGKRDVAQQARWVAADAMTELFLLSMKQDETKKALSQLVFQFWKDGNCIASVPWVSERYDLSTWRESSFKPMLKYVGPGLRCINLKNIWLDIDKDTLEQQPMIYIQHSNGTSWTELVNSDDFLLPTEEDGGKETRMACGAYKFSKAGITKQAKLEEQKNANIDGDASMSVPESYETGEIWITLPIEYSSGKKAKWDEDAPEYWHRVSILGTPGNPFIMEIVPNSFPLGLPLLLAQETEDNIGIYHQSRSELVKEYCKQIQTAQDQMMDNRDRNNNRQFFYNPMDTPDLEDVEFNNVRGIPTNGSPSDAHKIMELKDMTSTNLLQIKYCEDKTREALNTGDAVLGVLTGGRPSASASMQAYSAATAPILESVQRFEENIIVQYMERFKAYVQEFMKPEDLVSVLGEVGLILSKDGANDTLSGKHSIRAEGFKKAISGMERFQKAQSLYVITKGDPSVKPGVAVRNLVKAAGENPAEWLQVPNQRDAFKAALLENVIMLEHGKWDDVEETDDHTIHIKVVERGIFEAEQDESIPPEHINLARTHLAKHKEFENRAASMAASPQLSAGVFGPPGSTADATPGEQRGQELSASQGNVQGGSSIPLVA